MGVDESKLRAGSVYCGWCEFGHGKKVKLVRDVVAEGDGYLFEEPTNPTVPY